MSSQSCALSPAAAVARLTNGLPMCWMHRMAEKRKRRPWSGARGYRNSNGRGTLKLDRIFPAPVGRINLASGTDDRETFNRISQLLTDLHRHGRFDYLVKIKSGAIKPLRALYEFTRLGKDVELLSTPALARAIGPVWEELGSKVGGEGGHRRPSCPRLAAETSITRCRSRSCRAGK